MELSLIKETIKKVDSKYVLYPKNGGKRLGTHSSKESAEKQERAIQVSKHGRSGSELKEKLRDIIRQEKKSIKEKSPEGWEDTVKAMKDEPDIDNPWALAHWMDKEGYKSHKESVNESKQKFVVGKEKFSPDVKKEGDQYIVRYKVRKPEQYGYEYPISKKMLRFMKKKLGEFTFITNAGLELHSREIKGGKWEGITIKKGYGVFESVNEAKMTHVLTKDIGKKKMKDLEQYLWHVLELVHNKDFRLSSNGKILSVNVDKINRKSIQNIKKRYGVDLKESVNEEIIDWQGG
jgi:hypothetical protein